MFNFTFTTTIVGGFPGAGGGLPPFTPPTVVTPPFVPPTTVIIPPPPPPIDPTGGGGGIISIGGGSSTSTPTSGGNTGVTKTNITGHGKVDNPQVRQKMGTFGKIVCGLFIVAALRKIWNFIFKTTPKSSVGINFAGKALRKTNGSKVINIVDAVLDNFDATTKMQNMFDRIGNFVNGSSVGDHCELYLQVQAPVNTASGATLPVKFLNKSPSDFSSSEPEAFKTWYNSETFSDIYDFFTKFKAQNNLGGLLMKTTTKEVEGFKKRDRAKNSQYVCVIRFNNQDPSVPFVLDPKCLVSINHLPPDILESICGDPVLFKNLLGKTKSKFDQSDCLNDCGQLLVEICPCYGSDSCDGYVATEKSYNTKSCACTKTKMVITFKNDMFTELEKPANAGKSISQLTTAAGGNFPEALKQFNQRDVGKLQEKILKDYFGYKSVITVTTDADEGDPVFSPRSYGPEDQNLADNPDENFEDGFYDDDL